MHLYDQHCDNLHKVMFRTEIQLGYGVQRINNELQMFYPMMNNEGEDD